MPANWEARKHNQTSASCCYREKAARKLDLEGVTGIGCTTGISGFSVGYDHSLITAAQLDEKVLAAGLCALSVAREIS